MPSWTLPYRDAFGSGARPYLALHVTGINQRSGPIAGLVDSGADRSSLPMGFADLMGYGEDDLELGHVNVADGSVVQVWHALTPSQAYVVGLEQTVFDLLPTFVPGSASAPLWGRADFFNAYRIAFDEPNARFTLSL